MVKIVSDELITQINDQLKTVVEDAVKKYIETVDWSHELDILIDTNVDIESIVSKALIERKIND